MTDAERIQRLEAVVEELAALLSNPSALKQRLETGWDVRGGEPRIIDAAGRTLDYAPAIQFLGSVVVLDVPNQRVLVSPDSGVALEFSADTTTSDSERIRAYIPASPTLNRWVVDTLSGTFAGAPQRILQDRLRETQATATPSSEVERQIVPDLNKAGYEARALSGQGSAKATLVAPSSGQDNGLAEIRATGASSAEAGLAVTTVPANGGADATTTVRGSGSKLCTMAVSNEVSGARSHTLHNSAAPKPGRTLYSASGAAHYMQSEPNASGGATTPVRRVMRGPFTMVVTALAAGASQTATITECRAGTDYAVMGGPKGAAGCEQLCYSWADSGTWDAAVTVHNPTAGALSATMHFYVASSA